MKKEVKIIFHIDLNAFFASCAIIKEPYLKSKTFVVGGSSVYKRGVISTASYNARKYGINSGMSINEALQIYPKLVIVPIDFTLYNKYSGLFYRFLKRYTNLVVMGSIDEAYLDLTEQSKEKHPLLIAKEIQEGLLKEYQLPSSIGIAPTLFLAKMASDIKKPLGITVLRKRDVEKILYPLPVKDIFGIGKKSYPKLMEKGILTIKDFMDPGKRDIVLSQMSMQNYMHIVDNILGKGSDIVDPSIYYAPKSISNETTLTYPISDNNIIIDYLMPLLKEICEKLKRDKMVAKTVGIRFKDQNFSSTNRSITLKTHTDNYDIFLDNIWMLVEKNNKGVPLRLVGVFVNQLMNKKDLREDLNLFNYQELTMTEEKLFKTINEINEKYPNKIKKGITK